MNHKKVFDLHGEQMNRIYELMGIKDRCNDCHETGKLIVANGPDDFDVVPCHCSYGQKVENDFSGATTNDR